MVFSAKQVRRILRTRFHILSALAFPACGIVTAGQCIGAVVPQDGPCHRTGLTPRAYRQHRTLPRSGEDHFL